ncbi:MAG: hypothetical protein MJD61_17455, partial [Proteobacteria bacterium]|nr:hypothetical protein [Pseudomonadota bacterium]
DQSGYHGLEDIPLGTYRFYMRTHLSRGSSTFDIRQNNADSGALWHWQHFTIQSDDDGDHTFHSALTNESCVAAIAAHMLWENKGMSATTYKIFASQDCPVPQAFAGCYHPGHDAVFLGDDNNGDWLATRKFIVSHEIGHYLSSKLGGTHSSTRHRVPRRCRCTLRAFSIPQQGPLRTVHPLHRAPKPTAALGHGDPLRATPVGVLSCPAPTKANASSPISLGICTASDEASGCTTVSSEPPLLPTRPNPAVGWQTDHEVFASSLSTSRSPQGLRSPPARTRR